ncbi:MAG: dipeptidase [Dehalococcoidia bacterium]
MDHAIERLHHQAVVVDCHHDLLLLVARDRLYGDRDSFRRRWIPSLRSGGVDVQVLPVFVEPEFPAEAALRRTLLLIAYLFEEVEANPDEVDLCLEGADIDRAIAEGKIAIILALEGSHAIGGDVELVRVFYRLGVRMASFSWFGRSLLADGSGEGVTGGGLTAAGVEALQELERLGIVMDVSHLSDAGVEHVLSIAARPVVASHSSARSVIDHHRNLTDDQIRGIAGTGGVIGINLFPLFIDPKRPTIDRVVDHLEHVGSIAGFDHVGIGTDFVRELYDEKLPRHRSMKVDGFDVRTTLEGLAAPADLPHLTERMSARGFSEEHIRKVLGMNFLRVFRDVVGRPRPGA